MARRAFKVINVIEILVHWHAGRRIGELRRSGVFELAHRLDGLTDWLEELLVADQDDEG